MARFTFKNAILLFQRRCQTEPQGSFCPGACTSICPALRRLSQEGSGSGLFPMRDHVLVNFENLHACAKLLENLCYQTRRAVRRQTFSFARGEPALIKPLEWKTMLMPSPPTTADSRASPHNRTAPGAPKALYQEYDACARCRSVLTRNTRRVCGFCSRPPS